MKKITIFTLILTIFMLISVISACGRNNNNNAIEETQLTTTATTHTTAHTEPSEPTEPTIPAGMAVSKLTGQYIPQESAARRPFAIVYNNENRAMPQSGLSQAALIYEVLAEGNITRIVAIFQDFDEDLSLMIGPIRSTRHYFTSFALDSGAVMVHHGGSPQGYNEIRSRNIPHIDGMSYDGTVFWRDPIRRRDRGLEHSSYTSAQNLLNFVESRNSIDMGAPIWLGMFKFYQEPTSPENGTLVSTITINFAGGNTTRFEFNPENNQYYQYFQNNPRLDANTDEHISVANVIIQLTSITHIPGDDAGRRNVALLGSGTGYLATNGVVTEIFWEKDSADSPTRWFDANGEPLVLNRGATWISVTQNEPIFE